MAENCQGKRRALKINQFAISIKSLQCIVIKPNERFLFGNPTVGAIDTYRCDLYKSNKTRAAQSTSYDEAKMVITVFSVPRARREAESLKHDVRERAASTNESSTVQSDLFF